MPCCCRKYTACESFSPKIATSTLAPVTSFLPEDCTCRMARWITRWKPSVGWVSTSRSAAMRGVCSAMCCVRFLRSSSMLAPQARSTSAAVGLSSRARSRCSTVMNSWRFCRASTKAMCRLTSSSCAIIGLRFLHYALQWVLMLPRVCRDLLHFCGCHIPRIDPTDADAFPVDLEHDLGSPLPGHGEEFLQDHDDKLHGGVVVVEQHDLEHRRRLQLRLLSLQYRVVLVLRHGLRLPACDHPNQCGGAVQCDQRNIDAGIRRCIRLLTSPGGGRKRRFVSDSGCLLANQGRRGVVQAWHG